MKKTFICLAFTCLSTATLAETPWEKSATADIEGNELAVFSRDKVGTDIREVKGVGVINAPAWVIKNVIDDSERFKEFMPYMTESKIMTKGDGFVVAYFRLDTPIVDDRDYTIKIYDESQQQSSGKIIWKNRWTEANALGPKPIDGVSRVPVNEGHWILEEATNSKTMVTYYVFTNPGGSIPTFVANMANSKAIPELFEAVSKASKDSRYQAKQPKPRIFETSPTAKIEPIKK
ncbi:hypothetical protein MEO40_26530 [Dolichospermum sp. ST_sed1]|nr:hypothetical protein [Dolichospermum sp. ST_sed1]